jgi:energy-coupling factor transporter ATP-binding protein EcfA2
MNPDHLPPHSSEAEAAILGCLLLSPQEMPRVSERLDGHAEAFYELRHRGVWLAMRGLHAEGKPIDVITLGSALRDAGQLDQVGGAVYLSGLADGVPAAALLDSYLDIVWTKYLARRGFNAATDWASQVFVTTEVTPAALIRIREQLEALERDATRHIASPKHLRAPIDFAEEFWARFFGVASEEPGLPLPIDFKLKIRPQETTLVTGDDGSGKSTVLSYFALHLAAHPGQKVCIASFEMPPPVTLWITCSQLLGAKHQPDSQAGQKRVQASLAWLQPRFRLYDFVGIGDWRDVLDTFRWAAEKEGVTIFILDSVMRIGIADDDYATQAIVASRFAQFAKETNSHLFYVIHENKGDARGKAKIRGSKLWSANADNVLRVERNAAKGEKLSKHLWQLEIEKRNSPQDDKEISRLEKMITEADDEWDTHLVLQKQRYPGTRQNSSRFVFFDPENFQLRTEHNDPAVNWLQRWAANKPTITT